MELSEKNYKNYKGLKKKTAPDNDKNDGSTYSIVKIKCQDIINLEGSYF